MECELCKKKKKKKKKEKNIVLSEARLSKLTVQNSYTLIFDPKSCVNPFEKI